VPADGGVDLVAIVVTDWVESTSTRVDLGEELADTLQRVHDQLVRGAMIEAGGVVVKGSGDGVLATFESATDAIAAAVAVQQRIDEYSRAPNHIAPIQLRVGVSVGDVVHQDGDIFGTPVVEAVRLEAAAEPGQILCSDLVRLLARGRGGFEFDVIGLLELKGLAEPVATCVVRWAPTAVAATITVPLPPELAATAGRAFVGRDEELDRGVALLGTGMTQVLWIVGEPGIGKTRLAAQIAAEAHAAGAVVVSGRCDEDVIAPYKPVIEAMRWFTAQVDDERLAAVLGPDTEPLARLLPELRTRLPGMVIEGGPAREGDQYRLFEAVRAWLATAAGNRGAVWLVDDVHWADRETRALLAYLVRSNDPMPLLLLATARDTDPDASDELDALIDDLGRTGRSRRLRLTGLTEQDVLTMATNAGLARGIAGQLVEETAGNPLFLTAVISSMRADVNAPSAALDIGSAVHQRVRRLEPQVQDLLQAAAVIGLEFLLPIAADANGITETECLDHVERAAAAGLIEEVGVDRFRFTHALVRDALASEVSASRRARLNAAIASAIETRFAGALDEHLGPLAHHYENAGDTVPGALAAAYGYAVAAARRAMRLLAFDAAVEGFAMALDLADRLGDRPWHERLELLVEKGEAQRVSARHEASMATLQDAAAVARAHDDWASFARAADAFGEAVWRVGMHGPEAVALLGEADDHAGELTPYEAVRVRASLGRAHLYTGDFEAAIAITEQALAAARDLGSPDLEVHALACAIQVQTPLTASMAVNVLRQAEEFWRLSDTGEYTQERAAIAEYGWGACWTLGDPDGADRWLAHLAEATERTNARFPQYVLSCNRQDIAFVRGNLAEAERQSIVTQALGDEMAEDASGPIAVLAFLIRREQDRLRELEPVVRLLLATNPTEAMWGPGLLLLLSELGMRDEALKLLEELVADDLAGVSRDNLRPGALCLIAEAAWRLDAAAPASLLERNLESRAGIGMNLGFGDIGPCDRYRGMLAALQSHHGEADRRFASAVAYARRMSTVVWEARALSDWAKTRRRAGDERGATEVAEQALELCERYGFRAIARDIDALGLGLSAASAADGEAARS
jgi:class 3 adenylate cyclase/tetratricopeptide (TPR) repeat protein/RecA/RadA recombinase